MKWLFFLVLISIAVRLFAGRWPWQMFGGPFLSKKEPGQPRVRSAARVQAQTLLGVAEGAGREDIIEAHKRLVAMVHPDRGGTNEQVHEANSARDLLLGELARRNTE